MSSRQKPRSASEWLVVLNDAPGDEALRLEHRRWLADCEGHRRDWHETLRTWQLMAMTLPAHIEDWDQPAQARETQLERMPSATGRVATGRGQPAGARPPRRLLRRPVLAVGGITAVAALIFMLLPGALVSLRADHSSTTGEVKLIDLEDGSRLQLAPESAVALTFGPSVRRIELLRGEAFFDVVAEPDRPFQVRAGAVETIVLGTRFAVGLTDESTMIAVQEGSVRVEAALTDSGETATSKSLVPGDVLEVGPGGDLKKRQVAAALVGAWRDGLLAAQHRPLGELVAILDRYFDGVIIIADPQLIRAPMTGLYKLSDPKAALEAMAAAQGAKVREVSPWILVLSRR
ncbi:FecR family protein [Algihabitans albus]|uniref:FecR family protein n=1 Tax=Algihabitans albus TaxID=2164067 RepID=UPI0013C2D671|nr:FecR domain-containing protein [Algihabitans albus]